MNLNCTSSRQLSGNVTTVCFLDYGYLVSKGPLGRWCRCLAPHGAISCGSHFSSSVAAAPPPAEASSHAGGFPPGAWDVLENAQGCHLLKRSGV